LGTGVSLIPLHHPLRLAEEYAMLDVLSNGRLEYGIGRGFLNYAYQLMGVDPAQSFERFREGTDLIIKPWTAWEPFSFQGKFWQLEDYQLFFPTPVQKPHPPIYGSGTMSQESYIYAGSRGLHLCTAFLFPTRRPFVPISRFIERPSRTMVTTRRSATWPACFRCTAATLRRSHCVMAANAR
jgi:alkanesulfonate monooxygenase SsuD/methylene tetrahydromethanopterin reductase-like flavin-dependent oxidoreductase (luciferase family)